VIGLFLAGGGALALLFLLARGSARRKAAPSETTIAVEAYCLLAAGGRVVTVHVPVERGIYSKDSDLAARMAEMDQGYAGAPFFPQGSAWRIVATKNGAEELWILHPGDACAAEDAYWIHTVVWEGDAAYQSIETSATPPAWDDLVTRFETASANGASALAVFATTPADRTAPADGLVVELGSEGRFLPPARAAYV
jgi:hypothetical protein